MHRGVVVAGIAAAFACGMTSAYGAENLSAALLPAEEVAPGAVVDSTDVLTGADIYTEPGAIGDVKRANVVAGVARRYETEDLSVGILLIEYRDNDWANDPVREIMEEDAPDLGQGVRIVRGQRDGFAVEGASVAKGRINIQVWAVSRHAGANAALPELLRQVLAAQEARVPLLPDLPKSGDSPTVTLGRQLASQWGAASALIVVGFAVWGQATAALRDQGSREWLAHHRFRTSAHDSPFRIVDVTDEVRRVSRRQSVTWALRTLGLAALLGGLFAYQKLSIWAALAILASTITTFYVGQALRAQRATHSNAAQGRAPAVTLGLGAAASGVLLALGVTTMSAAVAGWLLVERVTVLPITVPILLLGLAIMNGSRQPIRFAHRILQPFVRRQIEDDGRRPVLLLRSFQDDALEIRTPAAQGTFIDAYAGEVYSRFEEVVAWTAWSVGPVLAIGQPGTVLQPLGAARDYYSDDNWQSAVEQLAEDARAIVVVVGRSPGLVWEIQNIRRRGRLAKTVFVLPPVSPDESQYRVQVLASALDLDPAALRLEPHRMLLALRLDGAGLPILYVCAGRPGAAYNEALGRALKGISPTASPLTSPSTDVLRPGLDITNLLETFDPSKVAAPKRSVISRLSDVALYFVPS